MFLRSRCVVLELVLAVATVLGAHAQTPREATPVGAVRENLKDGLKYVWIPPGTFMMGCSPGDAECRDDEEPAHQVTLTKGFWLGQTEVTVGAYKHFAAATGRAMPNAPAFNNGWANDAMPIVLVSWNDAHDYCAWAGARLPTEVEWEFAERAGITEPRYGPMDDVSWNIGNSGKQTHAVGDKRPNGFGLYDILGNVWEWVNDWFDPNYYQSSPSRDPLGPASATLRVLRGGSWGSNSKFTRASIRIKGLPTTATTDFGIRCGGEVFAP